MNSKFHNSNVLQKLLLISSLLILGTSDFLVRQSKAQVVWKTNSSAKVKLSNVIWELIPTSEKRGTSLEAWEVVPEHKKQNQPSTKVIWESIDAEDKTGIPILEKTSGLEVTPPSSLEEAKNLLGTIPLKPSDYQPQLRISPLVYTADILPIEQWRMTFGTISPFESDSGIGNQNYSVNLDIGLNNSLLLSLFVSEAESPLNAPLNGFATQPGNFWQSYGAAVRWQAMNKNNWKLAISGSLEGWNVGSGGDDSFANAGDDASPNIFNNSGSRVFTRNLVGSLSLPVSWQTSDHWQFTFAPGVSFLPPTQGAGQGGAGTFYGTNPYMSGGILFQPFPEMGLTASLAQPIGSGTNSFDANLEFSRVPIYSAGINWDLNPRIGLQGLITNGFGTTPATALLALPSDNRMGYSASFVYTLDTADTPQVPLTPRQQTLSKGGITVNTALVPPDTTTVAWINSDSSNNFNHFIGYSISNIFQLTLFSGGHYKNVPQSTPQARLYANDNSWNWRVGGKAVAFSPLRGAPFWGSGYISMGRNIDNMNQRAPGYLFAETMATFELNKKLAINLNPKLAWSGEGNLWGLGLSSNIQLSPKLELIPEANIVINKTSESNITLGIRWHASDSLSADVYASTAASILDIGQLISNDEIRWGARLTLSF